MISGQTKLFVLFIGILLLILFLYNYNRPIKNAGNLSYPKTIDNPIADKSFGGNIPKDFNYDKEKHITPESANIEEEKIRRKFKTKNRAKEGEYKRMNYDEGERGNGSDSQFDNFFDANNSLIREGHAEKDEFLPNDETGGHLASYKPGMKKKLTDDDIFRSEDYLPKQTNEDWFTVMPEAIPVKNRHLINVSRPIGVNTVGTTLKNPSYDLRGGGFPNPKTVVSPWLQSSIEADINSKGFCNY